MILVLLLLLLFPTAALAQITPEEVITIRQIADLRMSPDGRSVAFSVSEKKHMLDMFRRIVAWFETHVRNK